MRKIRKTKHKYKIKKQFFTRPRFIALVLLIFSCGVGVWFFYVALYTQPTNDWFEVRADESISVFLPRDDAPHQSAMEWWYYNGHLWSESGKRFSFHHTVFLVNNVLSHMVSHASLSDHQTKEHYTAQRRTGGNSSTGTEDRFEFVHGNWMMVGGDGDDRLRVVTDDFSFDLNLTGTQEPVMHGGNGIISLDVAGDSYYYSRTRMAISGTVKIGDTTEKIKGISWFDHQWGDFSVELLSWDWFSLQLDDGLDVMIYQLRDKTDELILYTGTISQNGITETLEEADFTIVPKREWVSDESGIVYPVEWTIDIPQRNISLLVQSINESSEFNAMLTSYNIYWEGAVKIAGSHTGLGFMELYYMGNEGQ